jgi:hypothetical protein
MIGHLRNNFLGMWSGGHFKSIGFGQDIGSSRLIKLIQKSYESGVRTFLTADVYNEGHADEIGPRGFVLAGGTAVIDHEFFLIDFSKAAGVVVKAVRISGDGGVGVSESNGTSAAAGRR